MDLEAVFGKNMSKKKTPKSAFHGLVGSSFSQKKKVVFGNVKHLGDKKNISLNKSELSDNVFSNVDSVFDEKGANMTGINVRSLLNSAVNTPKAKHVNTSAIFSSPFDSVRVAKAVGDHETWASKDWFRALLFTLPVRTTAHDLGNLLERAGGKTCIINRSLETGNKIYCMVVGFASDNDLEFAFHMEPIFNGVKLSWARMDLLISGMANSLPVTLCSYIVVNVNSFPEIARLEAY
ncbi:hypothetical protein G9A89_013828 [Geosiphon pyriformis]|nr:hypothetical protein G9A89_013828 [Geosiphon pyriformis]